MQILERWAWRLTWLLPVWGAVTIPATLTQQPDAGTDFAAYADYVTTTRFLASHLVGGIAGTVLGILGIVGLAVILARTRVARSALAAATVAIVGCGFLLPVFGAAAFAQPAIGKSAHAGLAGAQQIDSDLYGTLTIAVGAAAAFAFTVGLAWLGVAVARSGQLPRWSGWLLLVAGLFIGLGGFLVGLLQPIGGLCLLAGGLGIAWLGPRGTSTGPAEEVAQGTVIPPRGGDGTGIDGAADRSHDLPMRRHHLLRAFTALCLATASLAAGAWIGNAVEAWPGNGRTATPKGAERMLERPVTLDTEACPAPFDATTRCGVATVPADWAKPDGRTLEIWFASIPAPSGTSTGVTVPFMGGPGEAISEVAELFLALVPALPDRDMLIVDVRGNGRSGRLGCPTLDTAQWRADGQEQVDSVARCAQEVGPRRDHYTTVGSVLDVEAIRRALNLPNPSLLGVSYGTWVVQTYTALFPHLVQAAVIDGIKPFDLDPWGRTYTDAMQRVLGLRCERTTLCNPDEADARVRRVAASLAAQPVPSPTSTLLLTEGVFSGVSIFAIQYNFADYLTAIDRALDDDYAPLLALTEAWIAWPPPNPLGGGRALSVVVSCNEYSAAFDLDHKIAKRAADFERRLAELPDDAFGWFSKQGWVDSPWEQVDFCLEYPKPGFSSKLRPPYDGPFPDVPVLMLNGDIDLQTPLESAQRAKMNWPNSVFLTIKDAPHVTIPNSECALGTALSFLQDPVLPDEHACDSQPAPN